jgi:ribosome-associated protein
LREKGKRLDNLKKLVHFLDEKKALNIKALDLSSTSSMVSYAIIADASNTRLLNALKDYCVEYAESIGYVLHHVEGHSESDWILIDLGTVCIHLFLTESRFYYRLEDLWLDKLIKL